MKKRKKILIFLLFITLFIQFNIRCKAECTPTYNGEVCTGAEGEGKTGTGASNEGGHNTDWVGSGINVDITPTTGSELKGTNISFTNDELRNLGINPPTSGGNTNLEHAEDWKKEIASLGEVINGDKNATPFQKALLDKMAEKNGVTTDEFIGMYKNDALKNGSSFEYKDTPYATVCKTDGTKCGTYTDSATCTAELGDYWGCYGVDIAIRACGTAECIGDDGGKLDELKSCMERLNDAYACCVEEYGEAACKSTPTPGKPTITPGSCNPAETTPTNYPSKVLYRNSPKGSTSCGGTYTTYDYSFGQTACEYVNTLITTTTTYEYPGIYGTYEAGEQLNFSNVVYWSSTRTESVWDDSPLRKKLYAAQSELAALENQKSCLNEKIDNYRKKINSLTCTYYVSQSCVNTTCGNLVSNLDYYNKCVEGAKTSCNEQDCSYKNSEEKCLNGEIQKLDEQIQALEPKIKDAQKRIDELNACGSRANSFRSTSKSTSGNYTLSGTYLSLENYKQPIDSIKGIAKNSGQLLTENELSGFAYPYFDNDSSFVIPITTKNGTNGKVVTTSYSCPIKVTNMFMTDCKSGNCGTGGINVIYRPISLTNPFPNIKLNNVYRAMGANWNINFAETVIKNNRGVADYEVYNKTPIYTIRLDATTIKEIRKYNKTTTYSNFDMECTDGYLCKSNFLWGTTANGYNFSKIIVQSESCATAEGWSACYGGVD